MRNLNRPKLALRVATLVVAITLAIPLAFLAMRPQVAHAAAAQANSKSTNNPVCARNGQSIELSQGGQMFCKGPQSNGPTSPSSTSSSSSNPSFGSNVDTASPQEDVTPSGVQIHGQSEVSVASAGPYVVEAWNDGTGFFAPCGSPMNKEELTGFGFSNDGGKTFTDLGGLPNANCATSLYEGDPSVGVYTVGGSTYFYISSIFIPFNVPEDALAMAACKVVGSGATATLSCSQPIVAAISSDCATFTFDGFSFTFCSFLDKDFLSVDPVHGRLYVSYTEFGVTANFAGEIELAACDLSSPASPTCHNGSDGSITGTGAPAAPYFVVAPGDPNFCENEGAYPAVDAATGAVYVGYEHDWFSGLFNCGPGETTQNVMNSVPFSCLTLSATSPCSGPAATQAINIDSLEAAFIPGYNRFPMNDFPRLAVSDPAGTVSMVWNDARQHGTGDIFLQSFNLGSLTPVQSGPVRINSRTDTGGWTFLPAVRQAGSNGSLNVSFYSRSSANTALTNVKASLKVDPRTTITPTRSDTTITTGPSDWNAVSSIIIPNFGDYTDNYFVGTTLYVAWSDGRLGFPNPFEDHVSVH
jgi:hypothetical protein